MIKPVPRLDPRRLGERLRSGDDLLLVCAYDDILACNEILIPGALPLVEFKLRLDTINPEREIVFYCACAGQETAVNRAREYRDKGFVRAAALKGDAAAWLTLLEAATPR